MNQQRVSYWVAGAELGSAIAIVITLIVPIYGIRKNVSVPRLAMYADHVEPFNLLGRERPISRIKASIGLTRKRSFK